jgi:hypothetical protein
LNDSASIVSVANTAVINLGIREWVQIASTSGLIAQSLVAGSQQSLDSGNRETVHGRISASENGIANISSASQSIEASNVCTNTSNLGIASIVGTSIVIIAVSGVEWNVVASSLGITEVLGASILVIANSSGVHAFSGSNIAGINSARVSIIAVKVGGLTSSKVVVALVDLAVNWWASDVEASIAGNLGMVASSVSSSWSTGIVGARVKVLTALDSEFASAGGNATWEHALIGRSADRGSDLAASGWIAVVVSAEVSIVASNWGIDASVSIDSSGASSCETFVSGVTSGWANAGSRASAESFASTSAWVAWNIDASSLDK